MEPFDYLTYKQNKYQSKKAVNIVTSDKRITYWLCFLTFAVFFTCVISFISSKTAKIDIEYEDFNAKNAQQPEFEEEPVEKLTIDKRLFLLQQEERGPSISKVVETNEQNEVISRAQFDDIKSGKNINNENLEEKTGKTDTIKENNNAVSTPKEVNKLAIKPKIPIKPKVSTQSAINSSPNVSKVLIGKFSNAEDARKVQNSASAAVDGVQPFVKKIGNVYTVQVGSYQNFEIAKTIAGKLKQTGFDVWILQ